jgi:uncharacterized membrane protein YeaQ/YmgE (transglycosylase-associated protein family)
MDILYMLIVGLVAGALAKLLMPGDDPGGIIATMLLGIGGSFVGGFLARTMGRGGEEMTSGLIGSVIGAFILLFLYRVFTRRRRPAHPTP